MFKPAAISFLRSIEKNNDRAWFVANKPKFVALLHEPMVELLLKMQKRLTPTLADYQFDPKRAMYRIYRDTRFSKDKTPLKTHYGFQIQHPGVTKNLGAGFYFHLGAKELAIGGGIYMPSAEELLALRLGFVRDEAKVRTMIREKKLTKAMGPAQGDSAVRVPRLLEGAPPGTHDLVRRKQIFFYQELSPKIGTEPGLDRLLFERFKLMSPLVEWVNHTLIAAVRGREDDRAPKRPEPMF